MSDAVPAPDVRSAATPNELFDLGGRVAIVTGASSGLGAGVARSLAAAGASVVVVARRLERLEALADEIGGHAVACDLLDDDTLATLVDRAAEWRGGPEILVNAAGNIFSHDRAEDEPVDNVRRTLDLDLVAPYVLSQRVFPYMRDVGRGSIVNISSISGHVGVPGIPQASYAAAKLGLSGLSKELAVQWSRHGVRVNTIAPGFFQSEITDGLFSDEKSLAWLDRNQLLRHHASVDDFVGGVLWLASDASRFVTGQTIVVDGGWTVR